MQKWAEVEVGLRDAAQRMGINIDQARSTMHLTRALVKAHLLEPTTAALLDDLRGMRNMVAHVQGDYVLSAADARSFKELANSVLRQLTEIGD
jgi:uncharacterized protein YutE (UPF0331/DUF86 family)